MGQFVFNPDADPNGLTQYVWQETSANEDSQGTWAGEVPPDIATNGGLDAGNLGGWSQKYLDWEHSHGRDPAGSAPGAVIQYDPSKGSVISQMQSYDDGSGGWLRNNGWAVPLAAAAAFGGLAAAGAGAAEAGTGVAGSSLEGMGGGFVPSAGSGASFGIDAGATYGSAGLGSTPFELPDGTMGSIQNGNILDSSGNIVAQGGTDTSLSDLASYANKARQGYGILNSLSKLLGGSGSTLTGGSNGSVNPQQLANLLSPKASTNDFIGQYKMNQNPFTFSGQTQISPNQYDVSGSNIANALRKPNGTNT